MDRAKCSRETNRKQASWSAAIRVDNRYRLVVSFAYFSSSSILLHESLSNGTSEERAALSPTGINGARTYERVCTGNERTVIMITRVKTANLWLLIINCSRKS